MPTETKIEVCANSLRSALIAQECGAHRIELCTSLNEGGLTPSAGLIVQARKNLNIPIHALIRPRGGDFSYTSEEISEMMEDIQFMKEVGIDGIVIGALDKVGNIDFELCRILVEIAGPMDLTFHRAFDMCRDPFTALMRIKNLGFNRILTSGQANKAIDGIDLIKELIENTDDKISIMPGSGINAENIKHFIDAGAKEIHVSASSILESKMTFRREDINMGGVANYPEFEKRLTDPDKLKAILKAI
ncbi:MAG: copper homeostasis protein CutC [Bacteroidetes bacterium]|nr:copper homeostasis protein CutC [Bacteroidota bacterium]